jgi:hypothetical protein
MFYVRNTGRAYIGSSSDTYERFDTHHWLLRNKRHFNAGLQAAIDAGYEIDVIVCPVETSQEALSLEQGILDEFFHSGLLYNRARFVERPRLGVTASEETIRRQRESALGFRHSPETIEKLSELAKARGVPRSTIEAGAAARRGKPLSKEHIAKLVPLRKAAMTAGAREHLRRLNLGIPHSEEDRAKMKAIAVEKFGKAVVIDGITYPTMTDAMKALRIGPQTLRARLSDESGAYPNWRYVTPRENLASNLASS